MQAEISVIVPVYNVCTYLQECLDSILAQSFRALEILLIDDGSTDGSGQICDRCAKTDSRIRVIHQANQGLSMARNRGIELAQGRYLSFIDSDDYIAPDMLQSMHAHITSENADVAVCGIYRVKSKSISESDASYRRVMSGREFLQLILIGDTVNVTVCDKLFRRECFEHVRFPKGKITEDGYVAVDLYPELRKVAIDLKPKYYYRLREGSISTAAFSAHDYDTIEAYARCLEIVNNRYPECLTAAQMRYYRSYFLLYDKMLAARRPDAAKIRKTILGYRRKIIKNPYIFRTRKAGLLVLCVSAKLYRTMMIHYENLVNQRSLK